MFLQFSEQSLTIKESGCHPFSLQVLVLTVAEQVMLGMVHICPLMRVGLGSPDGIACFGCTGEKRTRPEGVEPKMLEQETN